MARPIITLLLGACLWACNSNGTSPEGGNGEAVYTGVVRAADIKAYVDTSIYRCSEPGIKANFTVVPGDSALRALFPVACRNTSKPQIQLLLVATTEKKTYPPTSCNSNIQSTSSSTYEFLTPANYHPDTVTSSSSFTSCGGSYTGVYQVEVSVHSVRQIQVANVDDSTFTLQNVITVKTPTLLPSSSVHVEMRAPGTADWRYNSYYSVDLAALKVRVVVADSSALDTLVHPSDRDFLLPGDEYRVTVRKESL